MTDEKRRELACSLERFAVKEVNVMKPIGKPSYSTIVERNKPFNYNQGVSEFKAREYNVSPELYRRNMMNFENQRRELPQYSMKFIAKKFYHKC